ncbi:hypothetical protein H072_4441 [Dactylellina haptotyla CBS 200.50]|uniref:Uncharacterized protein n=1 Tax=Dactylellina haptotyla (strain CBS 200.50) TaxID=1284197 RepID=S8BQE4_DACHA|nr:hypothetical protein H072_4441 [Dactylellina haptotyla CBS 200.50]
MHSKHLIIAALSLTATALPIANPTADVKVSERDLLGGLLGPDSLLGGLLGGVTGGGDAVGGLAGGLPVSGLLGGLNLDGLLNGVLSLDDGLLGNLLGGLGIDSTNGLVGGLLGGLLGGGKGKPPFIDPTAQKVPSGQTAPAKPQDGFMFTNILVNSPKVGILDLVLQLLLGGKKSMFLTKTPMGSAIKSTSGQTFTVNPTSITAMCFSNDVTTVNPDQWIAVACTMNVLGVKEGSLIGTLAPQDINVQKRSVDPAPTTTNNANAKAVKLVGGAGAKSAGIMPETLTVDEIRLAFTPVKTKRDGSTPIKSVILKLGIKLGV